MKKNTEVDSTGKVYMLLGGPPAKPPILGKVRIYNDEEEKVKIDKHGMPYTGVSIEEIFQWKKEDEAVESYDLNSPKTQADASFELTPGLAKKSLVKQSAPLEDYNFASEDALTSPVKKIGHCGANEEEIMRYEEERKRKLNTVLPAINTELYNYKQEESEKEQDSQEYGKLKLTESDEKRIEDWKQLNAIFKTHRQSSECPISESETRAYFSQSLFGKNGKPVLAESASYNQDDMNLNPQC